MAVTGQLTTRARGGFKSCTYRDAQGRSWDATIVADGSISGYKIRLTSRRSTGAGSGATIDNVALATSTHGVGIMPRGPGADYNQSPSTPSGDLHEGGYEDGYAGGY
jgi:hypothetical protein